MIQNSGYRHSDLRVNGVAKPDASPQPPAPPRRTLPEICFELRSKIDAFLAEQTSDDVLRKVQNQVRVSMDVIGEALRRYG